jgi:hypothetical protein
MDGLEPEQVPLSAGLVYWQFCMLNILAFTEKSHRKIFMGYEQLVQHPEQECTRLCNFLDQQCGLAAEGAAERIEQMSLKVDTRQHHYQIPKALAEIETSTREQRALYDFLRVKTICPDEAFVREDFALYPGWLEYLQAMDMLTSTFRQE